MEKKPLAVIKIGGNVIDNTEQLLSFLDLIAQLELPFILVHGGGKIATELSIKMGIEPQMIDGRRITDAATLDIVTMVYGGLINKKIVAQLQARKTNALGITGADGAWIKAHQRINSKINYGFVGDIDAVHNYPLQQLINSGFTPVVAPLTHDGKGNLLNTNADTMASATAIALSEIYQVHLVFCFEKSGLLRNVEDENSLITQITVPELDDLKEQGIISGGMIPKTDNIASALQQGVHKVTLCKAEKLLQILNENKTEGTTFTLS
jgi:acetylglutamate kinase